MLKKINKEIQKIEQQKHQKTDKRNLLDIEIKTLSLQLKELNLLKQQYENLEKNTDNIFQKIKNGNNNDEI